MGNFNRDRGSRDRGHGGFGRSFGNRGGFGRGREKQMFKTVCSNCGRECEVPFKPTGEKPVYCSDCFEKLGKGGNSRPFDRPRFADRKNQSDQYKVQFDELNAKLDKVLEMLQPKPVVESVPAVQLPSELPSEVKEVKVYKAKKTSKKDSSKNKAEV